jgi:hypothetical protein
LENFHWVLCLQIVVVTVFVAIANISSMNDFNHEHQCCLLFTVFFFKKKNVSSYYYELWHIHLLIWIYTFGNWDTLFYGCLFCTAFWVLVWSMWFGFSYIYFESDTSIITPWINLEPISKQTCPSLPSLIYAFLNKILT